jgi:hypothetical protein
MESLKALTGYRPMSFSRSVLQIAADLTSGFSLVVVVVFLGIWAWLAARR